MKVMTVTAAGLVTVISGILYVTGPGFRTRVNQQMHGWVGWTDAARQADPVGFANHVQQRLRRDLETMQTTRRELQDEVNTLGREVRNHRALVEHAQRLADEFRDAYQDAAVNDGFPVIVRSAAYTGEQVESQVSLLLAEADGYRTSLHKLEQIQQKSDEQLQALTVRINNTQAQLAMLPARRELLRARRLSEEGVQLLARLDQLLEVNHQTIQGNPVRSVVDLVETSTRTHQPGRNIQAAHDFLAAKSKREKPEPAVIEKVSVVDSTQRLDGAKPIFQQDESL